MRSMEETGVFSDFIASVFTSKGSSNNTQAAESKGKNWEKGDLLAVSDDLVWDHLKNQKLQKSMGSNKIHLQILRVLAN